MEYEDYGVLYEAKDIWIVARISCHSVVNQCVKKWPCNKGHLQIFPAIRAG